MSKALAEHFGTTDLPEGYGLSELGPLPDEWRVVRLKEITAKCFCGVWGDDAGELKEEELKEDERVLAKVIRVSDINSDLRIVYYKVPARAVKTKWLQKYLLRRGDIVVVKSSGSKSRVISGRSAIFEPPNDGETFIPSNFTLALRINSEISDAYFAWYYLLTRQSKEWVDHIVEGSTYPNLKKTEYMMMLIPLPPLPEQRAIAYVLRTVQRAREATERVIAATRELKKSLMRHLFTYGPVPVDAADQVPMQETDIGPIPAHWRVVGLGEVARITMGQSPPGETYNSEGDGIPLLNGPAEFGKRYPKPIKWSRKTTKVGKPGDILLCVRGHTTGRLNIADRDYCLGRGIAAIASIDNLTEQKFLCYLLEGSQQTILDIAAAGGSTFPNITRSQLYTFPIPFPPLCEQREIGRILEGVDHKLEAEEARKLALEALFKTLLHDLMTARRRLPREFVARFEGDSVASRGEDQEGTP
jgi:type I restriction enzyme S subunit